MNVRLNIGIMFLLVIVTMAGGLYVVQHRAQEYATKKAAHILNIQRELDKKQLAHEIAIQSYQTNYTTCGLRALIDPQLVALRSAKKRALSSSKDLSQSLTVRNRAKLAMIQTEKQIENTVKVRKLFGTIPPGFNCKTLAKNPPK